MILKKMTNIEEFFKNRITFTLHPSCRSSPLFVPHQQKFRYISNNIFTPEEYSLKFFFTYYLFSCYLLNYRQRIIRGEQATNFKWGIEIYVVSSNHGVFNDFNDIEYYKIPLIKLELIGDYFDTVKMLIFFLFLF